MRWIQGRSYLCLACKLLLLWVDCSGSQGAACWFVWGSRARAGSGLKRIPFLSFCRDEQQLGNSCLWIRWKQSVSSAGERKTVPRSCKNKSLSFKIKALQKDELKSKNKVTNVWCAPCYNWIVWSSLVRSGSIVSLLEKQRFHVGGLLIIPCRWDGPLLRGAVGHFVSWPMEGQSSTSRSGWGHHRGPVSTGGVFSSGGKLNSFVSFPSELLRLWDSERYRPQH